MDSGWEIIRLLGNKNQPRPSKSICTYDKGIVANNAEYAFIAR